MSQSMRMPRVVEEQLEAFRSDPILTHLAQGTSVRFSGCLHARESERRQTFMQNCVSKRLPITFPSQGVNLELNLSDVREQNGDVHFESHLIFNGVCCRIKGRINRNTLVGTAQLEFDVERADAENKRAQRARIHSQRANELRNIILQ